jgi:hypothetical protein
MKQVGKGMSFSMHPSVDQTGQFAMNLDLGDIGALQVSRRKVLLNGIGDLSRLKSIAAAIRMQLNIMPAKQPRPALEQPAQEKILILCESSEDVASAKRLKFGNPPMAVIALPAMQALTEGPPGIERIASDLRESKIVRCLLIARSGVGPAHTVAAEWGNLESTVQRNGVLDIVKLEPGDRLRMIRSNSTRLAQLDLDSAKGYAPSPPDEEPPDPDPW